MADIPDTLPQELHYVEVNREKLKESLNRRNSLLADEPYFSAIISAGEEYDVNPLLLFAITGQEQSFVPRTDTDARKIANNPFNVKGSWMAYNTNISNAAKIAAGTVVKLSADRPATVNPILWINTRGGRGGYARHTEWYIGVSKHFAKLKSEVGVQ